MHAGADAVGFVFAAKSPRRVEPSTAAELVMMLPPFVKAVGVFKDQSPGEISRLADAACIDTVQIHGALSPSQLGKIAEQLTIIRAAATTGELIAWSSNPDVDLLLVDASEGSGASGQERQWNELEALRGEAEELGIFLAGGLTSQNVGDAIRSVRPFGVDVSSGVEESAGVKSEEKIAAFCRAVRAADVSLFS